MLELTSRELEKKLIEKYRLEGDLTAFDQLVNDGLRLSISIARKYSGDQTRLTIIGMIGWFKAITKFDIKKTYRLATYATWWINEEISKYQKLKSKE